MSEEKGKDQGSDIKCPYCNNAISVYSEQCPYCNANLLIEKMEVTRVIMPDEETSDEYHISLNCPLCNRPLEGDEDFCAQCLAEMEASNKTKDVGNAPSARVMEVQADHQGELSHPVFNIESQIVSALRVLKPDNCPRTVVTVDEKELYYLFAGHTIFIGRDEELSHVRPILYPEQQYLEKNLKVSRQHSRLEINRNQLLLIDLSINGTYLNSQRLSRNTPTGVKNGDTIGIAGSIDYKVSIYGDEELIHACELVRQFADYCEHYLLLSGVAPVGRAAMCPIRLAGGPECVGSFFFNPHINDWVFRYFQENGETADVVLDFLEEFTFGQHQVLFSNFQ